LAKEKDEKHANFLIEGIEKALANNPKKFRTRNLWKITSIILILVTICSVSAFTILYTLNVDMTFKVTVTRGLELQIPSGTVVTSVDFGEVGVGASVTKSGILKNTGNSPVNVEWVVTPSGWTQGTEWTFSITGWTEGTTKSIAVGASIPVDLVITEVNAVVGVTYSASLSFNVVE